MEVKEITVSRSVRVNTGNYEGLEHFVSMKAELDEFDNEGEAHKRLCKIAEAALTIQLQRSYQVRGKGLSIAQVAKRHGLSYAGSS